MQGIKTNPKYLAGTYLLNLEKSLLSSKDGWLKVRIPPKLLAFRLHPEPFYQWI
jgi:hypothetical protein